MASGIFNTFQQNNKYYMGMYRYINAEWYIQDTWKVNRRLTLDYGMRFVWSPPQYDADLQGANFLPSKFDRSQASLLYRPGFNAAGARVAVDPRTGATLPSANIGRIIPGTGSITNGLFLQGQGIEKGLMKDQGIMFGPRFGFAYDVLGSQAFVLRGGGRRIGGHRRRGDDGAGGADG
ncbi:MAG: hypothetical protein H7Z39_15325 [Burkholderiaceae bacterium]|nr:hypothetical protein [Burkholderiaceae bacterium]